MKRLLKSFLALTLVLTLFSTITVHTEGDMSADLPEDLGTKNIGSMGVTIVNDFNDTVSRDNAKVLTENLGSMLGYHSKYKLSFTLQNPCDVRFLIESMTKDYEISAVLDSETDLVDSASQLTTENVYLSKGVHTLVLSTNALDLLYKGVTDDVSFRIGIQGEEYEDAYEDASEVKLPENKPTDLILTDNNLKSNIITFNFTKIGRIQLNMWFLASDPAAKITYKLVDFDKEKVCDGELDSGKNITFTTKEEYDPGVYTMTLSSDSSGLFKVVYKIIEPNDTSTKNNTGKTNTSSSKTKKKKQLSRVKIKSLVIKTKKINGSGVTGATIVLKYSGKTYKTKVKKKKWSVKIKGKLKDGKLIQVYQKKKGYKSSSLKRYRIKIKKKGRK